MNAFLSKHPGIVALFLIVVIIIGQQIAVIQNAQDVAKTRAIAIENKEILMERATAVAEIHEIRKKIDDLIDGRLGDRWSKSQHDAFVKRLRELNPNVIIPEK